jgi:pyridoxal phosphate enzyme (YggS family)
VTGPPGDGEATPPPDPTDELPPLDPAEVAAFAERRARVLERIAGACARAGRPPSAVTLVAVCKTVPAERVRAAVAAGLDILGENRVQEGAAKRPLVAGATWHLVGPLQANKARRALETFEVLEAVDSLSIAVRLDAIARERGRGPVPVFLQVNVDEDPSKAGFMPVSVADALPALAAFEGLRLAGLMTIGRLVTAPERARPTFAALATLSARLRAAEPRLGPGLSMGMTDDFEVAIEEGATHVRVGRALFGERPPPAR